MPIENNNSYYSEETHTAYPTIDYIYNKTGEDLTILAGSELRAKAEIENLTDEVKAYLLNNKLRETFNYMEYLIAYKLEWRNEWNRIIASVVFSEYNDLDIEREQAIAKFINGSSLFSIERFNGFEKEYRLNYRVGY